MRLPRSSSRLLTSGLAWIEKISLLTLLPMTFKSAPLNDGGHHRTAAEGRDVDVAGDQHLGQLGGAGNEDDLIFQTFFGEKARRRGRPRCPM